MSSKIKHLVSQAAQQFSDGVLNCEEFLRLFDELDKEYINDVRLCTRKIKLSYHYNYSSNLTVNLFFCCLPAPANAGISIPVSAAGPEDWQSLLPHRGRKRGRSG